MKSDSHIKIEYGITPDQISKPWENPTAPKVYTWTEGGNGIYTLQNLVTDIRRGIYRNNIIIRKDNPEMMHNLNPTAPEHDTMLLIEENHAVLESIHKLCGFFYGGDLQIAIRRPLPSDRDGTFWKRDEPRSFEDPGKLKEALRRYFQFEEFDQFPDIFIKTEGLPDDYRQAIACILD